MVNNGTARNVISRNLHALCPCKQSHERILFQLWLWVEIMFLHWNIQHGTSKISLSVTLSHATERDVETTKLPLIATYSIQ